MCNYFTVYCMRLQYSTPFFVLNLLCSWSPSFAVLPEERRKHMHPGDFPGWKTAVWLPIFTRWFERGKLLFYPFSYKHYWQCWCRSFAAFPTEERFSGRMHEKYLDKSYSGLLCWRKWNEKVTLNDNFFYKQGSFPIPIFPGTLDNFFIWIYCVALFITDFRTNTYL